MPYWQLFYHLVWATKHREPRLVPQIEPIIYDFLRAKSIGLGAALFALNGTEDHVHMVVSIPPKIAVSKFIGQIKAVSSVKYNQMPGACESFYWQEEYGAFSFDARRLPNYIQYVERQKEHHARNTTIPILERIGGDGVVRIQEQEAVYAVDGNTWRNELIQLEESLPGEPHRFAR